MACSSLWEFPKARDRQPELRFRIDSQARSLLSTDEVSPIL